MSARQHLSFSRWKKEEEERSNYLVTKNRVTDSLNLIILPYVTVNVQEKLNKEFVLVAKPQKTASSSIEYIKLGFVRRISNNSQCYSGSLPVNFKINN